MKGWWVLTVVSSQTPLNQSLQRLEPILYRNINVYTENTAQRVIHSLSLRQKPVLKLFISTTILLSTTAWLLHLCPHVVSLNMQVGDNSLGGCSNSVINALNDLTYLTHLSVDPALLFRVCFVYLPDARAFDRITHLDLTMTWTWESSPRGLEHLLQLTHLLLTWRMSHASSDVWSWVLTRSTFRIVVLWQQSFEPHDHIIRDLLAHGLDDPRIVVLTQGNYWTYEMHGSFWQYTAGIVAWRKKHDGKQSPVCVQDNTYIGLQSLP